ncbi:ABC transporter ATP-binding protein [Cellulomonas sp. P5_E12]
MIEVERLSKTYGDKAAVQDLSFTAATGRVTGLLGPNGAGKSTTMRMILGLHRPTSGTVRIDGRSFVDDPAPMTSVGAMLDAHAVHPGRTARNYLSSLAATHHLPATRVDEVLELTGMTAASVRRVGTYSLGMVQRLGIAAALLGSPRTLVLDEPVNGLDPDGVHWVRELVRSLSAHGTTVLLSSHLMSEMAQTADDVVVLGRGRLIAAGPMADVVAAATASSVRVRLATGEATEPLTAALSVAGGTIAPHGDALIVTGLTSEQVGQVAARTRSVLAELIPQSASLEDAFFELTKGSIEYTTGGTTR